MRKNKKFFNKKSALLTSMLLSASALITLGACSDESAGYTIPTGQTVEVGTLFTPDFKLEEGVTATVVALKTPGRSLTWLDEGSFTPDVTGDYHYTVRFKKVADGVTTETQEVVTVKAVDTVAPVFETLTDKTAETGVYTALAQDIASISVTDNCADSVTVYAESIAFGSTVTPLGEDATEFRLDQIGDYKVTVVAKDFSGNTTKATYKIKAQDTTAPMIDVQPTVLAWAVDGKVTVPTANVIDNGQTVVSVAVKNSAGDDVTVTDGKIDASEGVYTVTYTAEDASGNQSSAESKLIVKSSGVLSDFTSADEIDVWGNDGLRAEDGKMKLYYTRANDLTLEYVKGFAMNDWSTYTALEMNVGNDRGVKMNATVQLLVDGAWMNTATNVVAPMSSTTVKIYLADYGVEKVDGVRVVFNADDGVIGWMDDLKLTADEDDRALPESSELSGLGGGVYALSAQGAKEIALESPANDKGVVKYRIYANVPCDIMVTLQYENGAIASNKSLQAGWNEITRYPDAESGEELVNSALEKVIISSFENYPVTLYVAGVEFEDLTDIDLNAYAVTSANYSVKYTENFAIPSPFTTSLRWYKDLTVTLKKAGNAVKEGLTIGSILETVGDSALSAGNYTIEYTFKDLAGDTQTVAYNLTVEENVLTVSAKIPALFASETGLQLPIPEITSSKYGDAVVRQNAELTAYYRLTGRTKWTEFDVNEKFMAQANKTYDLRYVVEYDGEYREVQVQKFIHVNDHTIDFEPEDAVGNDMFAIRYRAGDTLPDGSKATGESYVKAKSRFLYDGGYYDYKVGNTSNRWEVTTDWSVSGTTSYTQCSNLYYEVVTSFLIRPIIVSEGTNAIQVWIKSPKKFDNWLLQIGTQASRDADGNYSAPYVSGPWLRCEPFELKEGAHQYTVFLEEPIKEFTEIAAIGMTASAGSRFYMDDLSFVRIERLEATDNNTYEDQLNNTEGYELFKPEVRTDVLSAEELAKVSYVLTYSLNGGKEQEIKPDANDKYILYLNGNGGEVKFKWTLTTPNRWSQNAGTLTRVFESPIVLIGAVGLDVEHEPLVMQNSNFVIQTPTVAEGEIADLVGQYKPFGTEEWMNLEEVAGGFKVPTDEYGWLDLRFMSKVNMEGGLVVDGFRLSSVYVRQENVLFDFEGENPMNGALGYYKGYSGGSEDMYQIIVDGDKNNHVMKVMHQANAVEGLYFQNGAGIVADGTYRYVKVRIYSSADYDAYPMDFWPYYNGVSLNWASYYMEVRANLKAGWNDVIIDVKKDFNGLRAVCLRILPGLPTIYLDEVSFLNVSYSGELPKATQNQEVTLPTGTCLNVTATISYRVKGTADWTAIEAGSSFIPTYAGTYEIRYSYEGLMDDIQELFVDYDVELYGAEIPETVMQGSAVTLAPATSVKGTITQSKIEYAPYGTEDWTETVENVLPTDTVGWLRVRYTGKVDVEGTIFDSIYEQLVYVRDSKVTFDFEASNPLKGGHTYFGTPAVDGGANGKEPIYEIVVVDEATNNHAMKILNKMESSEGILFDKGSPLALGGDYQVIKMRVHSNKAEAQRLFAFGVVKGGVEQKDQQFRVDLKEGWNDVTFISNVAFDAIRSLRVATKSGWAVVTLDDITFLAMEYSGEVPTSGIYGEQVTLPTAEIDGIDAVISYRVKGTADWTTITEGTTFALDAVGVYEVKYAFEGITDTIYEIESKLQSAELDAFTSVINSGETVTVPAITVGTATSVASYRVKGDSAWTAVENGSFVAESLNGYEVKFYFEELGVEVVKFIKVNNANEYLLCDFNTDFDRTTVSTYGHMNDNFNDVPRDRPFYSCRIVKQDGNGILQMDGANGWDGVHWVGGLKLDFTAKALRYNALYLGNGGERCNVYVVFVADNGKKQEIQVPVSQTADLGNGWYEYTVALDQSKVTGTLRCIAFRLYLSQYYIDDIRFLKEMD